MTWEDSAKQLTFQEGSMGAEQVPRGRGSAPRHLAPALLMARGREDLAGERLARTFGPFQDRRKTSLRLPSAISKNQEFS